MPIASEHAFKEKSTKLLILPSLRTIYNRTFQCETPCSRVSRVKKSLMIFRVINSDEERGFMYPNWPSKLHQLLTDQGFQIIINPRAPMDVSEPI